MFVIAEVRLDIWRSGGGPRLLRQLRAPCCQDSD